jgi:hypothetical protein
VLHRVATWSGRLFLLLGLVVFASLGVAFGVATVSEASGGDQVDTVGDLPPIYVITGFLVPGCLLLAYGCWWWLVQTFRDDEER